MLEILKFLGFSALFFRYIVWVAFSLTTLDKKWGEVIFGQIIEGLLLIFFFHQLFGGKQILPMHNLFTEFIGFFLIISGVMLAFVAKQQLGDAWVYASVYRIVPKQKLLTTGVYKIVRHPIYTGITLSFVGIELLASSWLWVSMLFFCIPFYIQAKKEEKLLVKHFGKKYKDYQQRTKMLIPWIV